LDPGTIQVIVIMIKRLLRSISY